MRLSSPRHLRSAKAERVGNQSVGPHCRTPCDIADPVPRLESQRLVEAMDPRILPAALHQHMVAVRCPGVRKCGPNDGFAVAPTAKLGVDNDVLQEGVAPSPAKQVRGRDQHAGRGKTIALVGHEDMDALPLEGLLPDAFGALSRLSGRAHLCGGEEQEEGWQIGSACEASNRHDAEFAMRIRRSAMGQRNGGAHPCNTGTASTRSVGRHRTLRLDDRADGPRQSVRPLAAAGSCRMIGTGSKASLYSRWKNGSRRKWGFVEVWCPSRLSRGLGRGMSCPAHRRRLCTGPIAAAAGQRLIVGSRSRGHPAGE
jgi:hypothetical protein